MKNWSVLTLALMALVAISLSAPVAPTVLANDPDTESVAPAEVSIEEFPIPTLASRPYYIDVQANGQVWFTETLGKKVGRLDPRTGTFTEYPVSHEPFDIAGKIIRGNVYFTEGPYQNSHFGVLHPRAGSLTEVETGVAGASATDCTADEFGNFWFNGWDSRSLVRVTGLATTRFTRPNYGYMSGLTLDPEGNLWMTSVGSYEDYPRLVKFNPVGGLWTEYPLPYNRATIRRTFYFDGRIWFTVQDRSEIGSYDPAAGAWAFYPTPTAGAGPADLAVDGQGRIWFTESLANQIGLLDLATGQMSEYILPTPDSQPMGIAVDAARGIVWFTERAGNNIGRLTFK